MELKANIVEIKIWAKLSKFEIAIVWSSKIYSYYLHWNWVEDFTFKRLEFKWSKNPKCWLVLTKKYLPGKNKMLIVFDWHDFIFNSIFRYCNINLFNKFRAKENLDLTIIETNFNLCFMFYGCYWCQFGKEKQSNFEAVCSH